ncbi:MAG: hypothetical protein RL499_930, partial [Actinomycetota bacterium]
AADFSTEGGYAVGLEVLADPHVRPTAIFAGCDEIAMGITLAARELGISVPDELSIIGIDGHPLSEIFGLTTLAQQPGVQGARAVELLLTQLEQGAAVHPDAHDVMPTTLTVRSSTTAPAAAPN